jgi:surface antigen
MALATASLAATAAIDGRAVQTHGTVCRRADGVWRIAN